MTAEPTTEKFVMIRHSVIKAGLTPQALALYAVLWMHADYVTRETFAKRETLASTLGMKKTGSIDRYIDELRSFGLITRVQPRWTTRDRDMEDIVFEKDADHPVQTSNLYTLSCEPIASPQVSLQSPVGVGGSTPVEVGGSTPVGGAIKNPLTHNPFDDSKSVRSAKPPAAALPVDWMPNLIHARTAMKAGLDVNELAALFRERMQDQKRRDWDKAFGAFINSAEVGRSEEEFHDVSQDQAAQWWTRFYDSLADDYGIDPHSVPADLYEQTETRRQNGETLEHLARELADFLAQHPDQLLPPQEPTQPPAADPWGDTTPEAPEASTASADPTPPPAMPIEIEAAVVVAAEEQRIENENTHRRERIVRQVARNLPGGIRNRERGDINARILAGENAASIVAAVLSERREGKAKAMQDLAKKRQKVA